MAPFPYLEVAAVVSVATYVLETYLDVRQHRALLRPSLSPALQGIVSEDRFAKARSYSLDKSRFHFAHALVMTAVDIGLLVGRVLPWAWTASASFLPQWAKGSEICQTIAFAAMMHFWTLALSLPGALYSRQIEIRHDFNKQSLLSYFKDMLLETALAAGIGPPLIAALVYVIQIGGSPSRLALSLWLLVLFIQLLLMVLYPLVIAPLFNKFTPLSPGPLRQKIEALASQLHFPLTKLYVVDGSARSTHSNAYMYGFYKSKRIVLYDTLLTQCAGEEQQVVAILAHELGHWKLKHTWHTFVASHLLTLAQFGGYALIGTSPDLFMSFGFNSQPALIGLLLFQQVMAPISPLLNFAFNGLSRLHEFQADAFARDLGFSVPLRGGLVKLQEENLGAMASDPWYSTYHYSHPPLVERLAAIDQGVKKSE